MLGSDWILPNHFQNRRVVAERAIIAQTHPSRSHKSLIYCLGIFRRQPRSKPMNLSLDISVNAKDPAAV